MKPVVSRELELETSLGVAIVSRRQDLLRCCIEEMSSLSEATISRLWGRIEEELNVEDVIWFKDNLHSSVGEENVCYLEPLTKEERTLKEEIETRVLTFFSSFVDRGKDLSILRNQRLYREQYSSWGAYCKAHFGWSRIHADRLIRAAEVVEQLTPVGEECILPATEFVARELYTIRDVQQRQEVWEKSIEIAKDKPVTREVVQQAKQELKRCNETGKLNSIPQFSIGDIVIISSPDTFYSECWATVESTDNSLRYKLRIGKEVIPFHASEIDSPGWIDAAACHRVIALSNSSSLHVRQLAKTFHHYTRLEQWQYNLLSYLEQVESQC